MIPVLQFDPRHTILWASDSEEGFWQIETWCEKGNEARPECIENFLNQTISPKLRHRLKGQDTYCEVPCHT